MPVKNSVRIGSKWGETVDRFVALDVGRSFFVDGDQAFANRLRNMIHVSSRTAHWKVTVTRAGENTWRVTKVGYWN